VSACWLCDSDDACRGVNKKGKGQKENLMTLPRMVMVIVLLPPPPRSRMNGRQSSAVPIGDAGTVIYSGIYHLILSAPSSSGKERPQDHPSCRTLT